MKERGGSKASPELLMEMVLANDAAISDPSPENEQRANLAVAKVWASERKAAIVDKKGDFTHIPTDLKQEFVRACDVYLADSSEENEAQVENLWVKIEALKIEENSTASLTTRDVKPHQRFIPNRMRAWFARAAALVAALLVFVWGVITLVPQILSPLIPTSSAPRIVTTPGLSTLNGAEIYVGVFFKSEPFAFTDPITNEERGLDFDMTAEICSRIHCSPLFFSSSVDNVVTELDDGRYEIAAGVAISEELSKEMDFSTPYLQIPNTLYVRTNETRFDNANEFVAGDYHLGAITGDFETAFTLVGQDRVTIFDTRDDAVNALDAGEVDAIISNNFVPLSGSAKTLDDNVATQEIAFAFPKESDWLPLVNEALAAMRSDGTLDAINAKWMNYTG